MRRGGNERRVAAMAAQAASPGFECRLDSAHDLAALLSALQLREKDQKDQRVHCEASPRGLKFTAQSAAKDVAVVGWIFDTAFKEYRFIGEASEMHLRLPVAPLLSCLQIFSDRAALALKYPHGPSNDLYFTLEEDGAVTECCLKTLVLEESPLAVGAFFAPGESMSILRVFQPESWYLALGEFSDLDSSDVVLRVTLRAPEVHPTATVILRAQTVTSDAEVVLPRSVFEAVELAPEANASQGGPGEVTHCYLLSSVLASCLRAARDAKAAKVRFSREGVMSSQFILRGRGQKDLFVEAMVSPLAEEGGFAGIPGPYGATAAGYGGGVGGASQSVGF